MNSGIDLNTNIIKTAARVIKTLITTQSRARSRLISELTAVCEKCDDAYSSLLVRLKPVRATVKQPDKLVAELRSLAGDASARKKFKPEKLCTEIDKLLLDLSSNVNALKYSVNFLSIKRLRLVLTSMGNYDNALYRQYDEFMWEMQAIAKAIENGKVKAEKRALAAHVDSSIEELQAKLRSSLKEIRKAKSEVVAIA